MIRRTLSVSLLALLFAGTSLPRAHAEAKPVKATKSWGGRIPAAATKEAPVGGYLVSEKALAKLWKAWAVKEKQPKIDFGKELVLVGTSRSSSMAINARLEEGNLTWFAIATADLRDDAVYQIITIPRAGIKTMRGKAIAKE